MGEVRPFRQDDFRPDPDLVQHVGDNMHELVELGLAAYKGDGTSTVLFTEKGVRLFRTLLAFAELHVRDADAIIDNFDYDRDAWLEVSTEWGVMIALREGA